MYPIKDLWEPGSLDEAVEMLKAHPEAMVLAGGTDLFIKLREGHWDEASFVSLQKLDELRRIDYLPEGDVFLGALATFAQIGKDPLIEKHFPLLKKAALSMGGPQVRNMATLGGNICNGAVSADGAPSMFALDARLVLKGADSDRVVPITDFYEGPGKVRILPGEILTGFILKELPGYGGEYIKFATRKAMDISMLGCAAVCGVGPDSKITDLRIALGTAAPVPVRCTEAEQMAKGRMLDPVLLDEIAQQAVLAANPRTSWRASMEYRQIVIKELAERAVLTAYRKAGGRYDEEN